MTPLCRRLKPAGGRTSADGSLVCSVGAITNVFVLVSQRVAAPMAAQSALAEEHTRKRAGRSANLINLSMFFLNDGIDKRRR
ncbi:hypothetical protein RSPO_m01397 (plasmid) [Ralstonia solanacearum Po82]|uniref:Uncharacterized protein n=1 Tax=Ralstonia solanacearum (strain Po82) TaxID=1031711 RepID=F6GBG6_RALS8|nr:hypothetical protein RSPO_m01397 [Ralstonia solanacearum Po82]